MPTERRALGTLSAARRQYLEQHPEERTEEEQWIFEGYTHEPTEAEQYARARRNDLGQPLTKFFGPWLMDILAKAEAARPGHPLIAQGRAMIQTIPNIDKGIAWHHRAYRGEIAVPDEKIHDGANAVERLTADVVTLCNQLDDLIEGRI